MAKITNKFDNYVDYVNAMIARLTVEQDTASKRIALFKLIIDIIRKKERGTLVDVDEYKALAKISCPDYEALKIFTVNSICHNDEDPSDNPEKLLFICPTVSCETCWNNYINRIAEALNESNVNVKNLDPVEKGETVVLTQKEREELEKSYVSIQDIEDYIAEATKEFGDDNEWQL